MAFAVEVATEGHYSNPASAQDDKWTRHFPNVWSGHVVGLKLAAAAAMRQRRRRGAVAHFGHAVTTTPAAAPKEHWAPSPTGRLRRNRACVSAWRNPRLKSFSINLILNWKRERGRGDRDCSARNVYGGAGIPPDVLASSVGIGRQNKTRLVVEDYICALFSGCLDGSRGRYVGFLLNYVGGNTERLMLHTLDRVTLRSFFSRKF